MIVTLPASFKLTLNIYVLFYYIDIVTFQMKVCITRPWHQPTRPSQNCANFNQDTAQGVGSWQRSLNSEVIKATELLLNSSKSQWYSFSDRVCYGFLVHYVFLCLWGYAAGLIFCGFATRRKICAWILKMEIFALLNSYHSPFEWSKANSWQTPAMARL